MLAGLWLYCVLLRSKFVYLQMLDPIQNHALRLCLGAFRTSPSPRLCVLANEPPLHLRRQKLSIQYRLKLSSTSQNPAYSGVFNCKYKSSFDRKPNKFPLWEFEFSLSCRLLASGGKTLQYNTPSHQHHLGSLLHRAQFNYSLHSLHKDDTAPEIFRQQEYVLWNAVSAHCCYCFRGHVTLATPTFRKLFSGVTSRLSLEHACQI